MMLKKWLRVLGVAVAISIVASTFTGCQINLAGGNTGGHITMGNSGSVKGTPMDASLDLDLGEFTVYGRPLGDWTYDEVYEYICNNYEEDFGSDLTITANGEKQKVRFFRNPYDETTAGIVEASSNIQINGTGVTYNILDADWCRSCWGLTAYNQATGDMVSSICGQSVESYLETICPGLYTNLQKEKKISLKNGLAMMDTISNGMKRISLCIQEGTFEIGYENGVITSLTVIYLDDWKVTTDVTNAVLGSTFSQGEGVLNLNLEQYQFMGKSFTSWNTKDFAEYVRNTYELEFDDGNGMESYFIGGAGSGNSINISIMPDGRESIGVYLANGAIIYIVNDPQTERTYTLDCGWTDSATLEVVGAPELEALLSMTPREYLEGVQPGLYDTLVAGESKRFENNQDIMRYVLLETDGSLRIQQGSISVSIRPNQETGLIIGFSVSFWQGR